MPVTRFDALLSGGRKYIINLSSPCNPSITRLCDSMHRELPIKGNPARSALTSTKQKNMISLAD